MNESIKKAFNVLLRTVIFCCFVMSVIMVKHFFGMYGDSITNDEDLVMTKDLLIDFGKYASLFRAVFFTSIAAAVLSVVAGKYKASGAAVFFRTALIGALIYSMSFGMAACGAIIDITDVADDIDVSAYEDFEDIDEDILIDAGMDKDRAQDIDESFKSEKTVVSFAAAPFTTTFLYFILSMTSLHNLLKKKPAGAHCGGCEDASRIENFDPSMLNGGSHFGGMNMPIGGTSANNIFAQRAQMMQGQQPFPFQQPVHDHHDSAALHDLEADGEFHNYAQAEADMTDDSSDYISQLQKEEGRGHRVTDEDFM